MFVTSMIILLACCCSACPMRWFSSSLSVITASVVVRRQVAIYVQEMLNLFWSHVRAACLSCMSLTRRDPGTSRTNRGSQCVSMNRESISLLDTSDWRQPSQSLKNLVDGNGTRRLSSMRSMAWRHPDCEWADLTVIVNHNLHTTWILTVSLCQHFHGMGRFDGDCQS
jgi:hypothetical protein